MPSSAVTSRLGGNFIDTAYLYTNGRSEEMIATFTHEMVLRDHLVLATKFTFNRKPEDTNAGGIGRKHIIHALEGSLRRLKTDYIDLYWWHAWDGITPEDEVMAALDALVRAGKVRYIGLSDVPAWYVASAQRLAQWRGFEPVVGLQLEYSLVERNIEREHVPAAQHFGLGITPWSPLAAGLLSGKYTRENQKGGRLETTKGGPAPRFSFQSL